MRYLIIFFILFNSIFSSNYHFDSVSNILQEKNTPFFISIGKDGKIISWNFEKNQVINEISFNQGALNNINFSKTNNYFAVSNYLGKIFILNKNSFNILNVFNFNSMIIENLYFISDSKLLLVYQNKKIILIDIFKKEKINEINTDYEILDSTIYNNKLIVLDRNNKLYFINLNNLNIESNIDFPSNKIIRNFLINKNKILLSYKNQLKLYDIETKTFDKIIDYLDINVTSLNFYNDNYYIGFNNGRIICYDNTFDNSILDYKLHNDKINKIIEYKNKIISISDDASIILYDKEKNKLINVFNGI
ncbi:MAG: WD40-like domain [Fusobacteriaceae bacterium]|jgi:WD40 repeat protein|nr:WD40-like domain [Fusobacteriaceae bacterium]